MKLTTCKIERTLNISYLLFGTIPLLWTLVIVIFHFYASNQFGFSPYYNHPDFNDYQSFKSVLVLRDIVFLWFIIALWCLVFILPSIFLIHLLLKYFTEIKMDFRIISISLIFSLTMIFVQFIPVIGHTVTWILD